MANYTPEFFNINIEVDLGNIKQVRKMAKVDYAGAFERGIDKGLKRLEELANARLQQEMRMYGLSYSNIAGNVIIQRVANGFEIVALGYVVYIEFGTGVVGANHPHPNPSEWDGFQGYDINAHGDDGWWYPTDQSDPNPVKWIREDGVLMAWTKGQIAKPFLHNTWRYVRQSYHGTISSYIERELRKELGK
jgi:hypothetical protein